MINFNQLACLRFEVQVEMIKTRGSILTPGNRESSQVIFRQHLTAFVCFSMSGNKCSEKPVSLPSTKPTGKPSPGVMDGGGES